MTRIGFIGLGQMGAGMAANLCKAGFAVRVHDLRPERVDLLRAAGATVADRPYDAALDADLICVAVFDEAQVTEVCGSPDAPDGVLAGARRGSVVAIHSTVSPPFVRSLAAKAEMLGVSVIDVAMSGAEVSANAGTLTFMVGGAPDAVDRARPALSAMASTVTHVGAVGGGVTAKIVNNLVSLMNIASLREGLRLARGEGLTDEAMLEIINSAVAGSWVSAHWSALLAQEAGLATMGPKDSSLALELAHSNGTELPMLRFLVDHVLPELISNGMRA